MIDFDFGERREGEWRDGGKGMEVLAAVLRSNRGEGDGCLTAWFAGGEKEMWGR